MVDVVDVEEEEEEEEAVEAPGQERQDQDVGEASVIPGPKINPLRTPLTQFAYACGPG